MVVLQTATSSINLSGWNVFLFAGHLSDNLLAFGVPRAILAFRAVSGADRIHLLASPFPYTQVNSYPKTMQSPPSNYKDDRRRNNLA